MNKSLLKKFSTSMRLELMGSVKNKIEYLLSDSYKDNLALYSQNKDSIEKIRERYEKEKEDFIEEVAYTWFNRLIALRFMDVNEITSSFVVSTTEEQPIPQIFIDAKAGNIDDELPLDRTKFFDLIDKKILGIKDHDNEAYKLLFISVCNYYSKVMPFMFEAIADYTELLLPDDMLSPNSFRAKVVESMPEEDCQDVEVIGWLYQFYIAEKKDDVFAKLKKNQKITSSNIPAATQIFTPHWIVKYMVENSLGKLWLLNNPTSSLKAHMKYYIENEEEENSEFIKINSPEELTFLDPCCGSGHTLTYAFDLLTLIYEEQGYSKSEIPTLILENNLFGCDIDKRASVLANFALTMKARQYHKRFFRKSVTPNIVELQEFGDEFKGIKNYGSLMKPKDENGFDDGIFTQTNREFSLQKKILGSEFQCLVTNPPYMGGKGMNKKLSEFVKGRYPNSKSDLFAVFIERGFELVKENGYMAMITMQSWMFLSSYEKMRDSLLRNYSITTMAHLDNMVMGIAFGTSATIWNKRTAENNTLAVYFKVNLDDLNDNREIKSLKKFAEEDGYVKPENKYVSKQSDFEKIPGFPIAYWINNKFKESFFNDKPIKKQLIPKFGMSVGDGESYIRRWHEVSINKIGFNKSNNDSFVQSGQKWAPCDKGGEYRRWYGNLENIVNWENDGEQIRNNKKAAVRSPQYFFQKHISWTLVSSGIFSSRYFTEGFILDTASNCLYFNNSENIDYTLAFLNTKIALQFLDIINPTINYSCGVIGNIPLKHDINQTKKNIIESLTKECIHISKEEWNSKETSWDFSKNELIKHKLDSKIKSAFDSYCTYWKEKFFKLHTNEEELNRLFIDIYELQDELTPDVDLKNITILKQETSINDDNELIFNADEIMKQFISYAVGVMLGRYSLDQDGLVVANLNQDYPKNTTFEIDDDNVIPVLDDEYFSDDIVSRFINFVKITFGEDSLSENIKFIEECLGKDLRKYFVKDFYDDHVRRYKKRPIYWMVSSPKKGFMSLIYMHRYTPDVFARVRNSYLTEYIAKLEAHKETLSLTTSSSTASNKDKKDADKQIKDIEAKLKEIIAFDRDIMMSYAQNGVDIDLDDGVKVNYCKFQDILYEFDKKLCK